MPRPGFGSARVRRAVRIDAKSSSLASPAYQSSRSQRSEMVRRRFELDASAQGQFVAVIGPLLPRTLSHSWSCVVVCAMTLPCRSLQVARATTVTA